MSFTPRTVVLLGVAALSAVFIPIGISLGAMVAITALATADAWRVHRVPGMERTTPSLLSRGVPARLVAEPVRGWPRIRIRQPVESADLVVSPPEDEGRLESSVVALRRGRHVLPPVATRVVGPLGLGCWYHRSGEPTEITVYPDMPAARRLALEVRVGRFREEGRRSRGPLGLGTDLESIREYLPDDDIRQVNWKATARMGTPMSNTFRVEQDRDVICLLDCGRLMAAPVTTTSGRILTRLDAAVDVVAAMTAVAAEVGDRIGLVAFADRILRRIPTRRDTGDLVISAIHDLEPAPTDSDYETAFELVAGMKRAFVLVLTDLLDDTAARPLVTAVGTLARRHVVAIAGVRDPAIGEVMRAEATSESQAILTAVAVDLVEAQRRATGQLTHRGATVIEAPVEALSAHCVAGYLRAKRRARL